VNEDVPKVRALAEGFLRALNGPDWASLPVGLDERTTIFLLPPSRESGQMRTWPEVQERIRQILVSARSGPVRPRLKAEWPRLSIEVGGNLASVSWRARGDDLGPRRVFGATRAITLAKEDGSWFIRHVQLWSLSLRLNATYDGVQHWLDVQPLLAAPCLPDQYLSPEVGPRRLWSFV
jgi:hypothetical protein